MNSERALIARVEAADPAEFAEILRKLSEEEGRVLRTYFGAERLQSMRTLALQADLRRGPAEKLGNVVVVPGIMASELVAVEPGGDRDLLWVSYPRLIAGQIDRLRLDPEGRAEAGGPLQVQPVGIMKKYYGELILGLNRNWRVQAFAYDWRKDIDIAADDLHAKISAWFGDEEPVHLVAHSLGGLVARAFILRHGKRWDAMQDRAPAKADGKKPAARRGGRVVMLGTPNRGAYAIVQTLVGIEGLIRAIAKVDLRHDEGDLARICNTFVSTYQMLPAPDGDAATDAALYEARTYPGFDASQIHLKAAKEHHKALARPFRHQEHIFYVAGANRETLSALPDGFAEHPERLSNPESYGASYKGDGRVLWERGSWTVNGGAGPTLPLAQNWYYVDEVHADLPRNKHVRSALDSLLGWGTTSQLTQEQPTTRAKDAEDPHTVNRAYIDKQRRAEEQADQLARRVQARAVGRGTVIVARGAVNGTPANGAATADAKTAETPVSADEGQLRDLILRGWVDDPVERRRLDEQKIPGDQPKITVRLVPGEIQDLEATNLENADLPVDAIAVGHYIGVRPQNSELALDRAITAAMNGEKRRSAVANLLPDECVLTQFTDRQTFLGELGRPFFMDDPRKPGRAIAVAGMGPPGRLGPPELAVVARELYWALDRLGKRHLATVLIGAGAGNVPPREAVKAWLRGMELARRGAVATDTSPPPIVSFVIRTEETLLEVHQALVDEIDRLQNFGRLTIDYDRYVEVKGEDQEANAALRAVPEETLAAEWGTWSKSNKRKPPQPKPTEPVPTRLTLDLEGDRYRFSAITQTAAVPERITVVNPALVLKANDELAQEADPEMQKERGEFLQRLLIPEEFRAHLASEAPLVLLLDARTARIHWEMLAQPDPVALSRAAHGVGPVEASDGTFDRYRFLGTARGFTRQLRTTFAPPPEPPPPARRRLRVLVVADPADDATLPGAEVEGGVVADLFEAYNRLADKDENGEPLNSVQVTRLFGPTEATLTNVLRELMIRPYDLLHFAGHCYYNQEEPEASGYIFRLDPLELLSARELSRIDRVPRFVFSNACESGVTQDRIDKRSVDLPPSFAESFFNRGVANFVCTAWPVDDQGAREFATTMYARMLGLTIDERGRVTGRTRKDPMPIHLAMQEARIAIAGIPTSARTWGAYQHYGNPFYRFFATRSSPTAADDAAAGERIAHERNGRSRRRSEPEPSAPAAPAD